ncbi:MAG: hypothetical protein ACE37F_17095 [Nannocystaceae bacterium]|nr:hypothetical protein [bacterium]
MDTLRVCLLPVALAFGCSNTSAPGDVDPAPVEAPSPAPAPEPAPEPEPEPAPEPSEGKACGARAGNTCGDDEYCAYEPSGMCGWADATSVCKKRPQMCTADYDPVCGCDQKEYSNACAAAAAGQGVLKKGECKDLPGAK